MKSKIAIATLLFSCVCATAQEHKACDDLKGEIAKKLDAKGVVNYSLDVVDKGKEADGSGKVIGSCDGGTKDIVYSRGKAEAKMEKSEAKVAKADTKKPQQ